MWESNPPWTLRPTTGFEVQGKHQYSTYPHAVPAYMIASPVPNVKAKSRQRLQY